MAKKKNVPTMQEEVFEEMPVEAVEEEIIEEEVVEQTPEIIEEPKDEPSGEDFRIRTLKAINKMENHAKAKRLAERLMRKKARKQ